MLVLSFVLLGLVMVVAIVGIAVVVAVSLRSRRGAPRSEDVFPAEPVNKGQPRKRNQNP